jgi:phosphoribosyl 1,2-cyclic phosphodiesterase
VRLGSDDRTDTSTSNASSKGDGKLHPFSVRCWGTRGSIPSPGPTTARYGGNTSCVEVRAGECRIILDAGTGIRELGEELAKDPSARSATVFLTHFHWDHIHGFPFFAPAYDSDFSLRIIGPRQAESDVESLLRAQMGHVYFPIPYDALSANLSFQHLNEGVWEHEGLRMRAMRVRHPSFAVGYRVEAMGVSVVFIPDNELLGEGYPTDPGWRDELLKFVGEADLLLHDAMYTEEEYRARKGWGHSTFSQALDLAGAAGVKALRFFHHAPGRSDAELDRFLLEHRERASGLGLPLEVDMAADGDRILLGHK